MQNFYNNQEGKRAYKLEDGDLFSDFETEANKIDVEGKNIASQQEVIEAIKELTYRKPDLCITLADFATKYIKKKTGKIEMDGVKGDEFVSIVLDKIINVVRKWYKDKVKTIEALIFMAVISEIKNRIKTHYNQKENPLYKEVEAGIKEKDKKKKKTKPKIISLYNTDREGNIIENNIVDFEKAKDFSEDDFYNDAQKGFEELIEEVEEKLEKKADKDNGVSYCVFDERLKGNYSNKKTAKELGVDVREVENAVKVVKRVVIDITDNKK